MNLFQYRWKPEVLSPLLPSFVGGQFRLAKLSHTDEPKKKILINFQGEITSTEVPDMKIKRVVIFFEWLCERHFVFDRNGILQPRWSLIPPPPNGVQRIDFDFVVFYSQPRRNDRLKLKGWGREFCRLYRKDDPKNLVRQGKEFVSQT